MVLTRQQALDCFRSDDLIGIGMEADAVRRRLHPEKAVTYEVTCPACVTGPDLEGKVEQALDAGATGLTLLGRLANLAAWETLLSSLRHRFPSLWLHGLSATEVLTLATSGNLAVGATLTRLMGAGLQSLAGDDAGMLSGKDAARCSMQDWLGIHRAAHVLGLPSNAAMSFGAGESPESRYDHLEALGHLQQETGGFFAFRPSAAPLPNFEEATAVEYLTTLAVSRMVLDSIPHLEADWHAQGLKVLQMALRFGADDVGTTLPLETLAHPTGTTEEDLRRVVRGAGFRPVQRDTAYRTCFLT